MTVHRRFNRRIGKNLRLYTTCTGRLQLTDAKDNTLGLFKTEHDLTLFCLMQKLATPMEIATQPTRKMSDPEECV